MRISKRDRLEALALIIGMFGLPIIGGLMAQFL